MLAAAPRNCTARTGVLRLVAWTSQGLLFPATPSSSPKCSPAPRLPSTSSPTATGARPSASPTSARARGTMPKTRRRRRSSWSSAGRGACAAPSGSVAGSSPSSSAAASRSPAAAGDARRPRPTSRRIWHHASPTCRPPNGKTGATCRRWAVSRSVPAWACWCCPEAPATAARRRERRRLVVARGAGHGGGPHRRAPLPRPARRGRRRPAGRGDTGARRLRPAGAGRGLDRPGSGGRGDPRLRYRRGRRCAVGSPAPPARPPGRRARPPRASGPPARTRRGRVAGPKRPQRPSPEVIGCDDVIRPYHPQDRWAPCSREVAMRLVLVILSAVLTAIMLAGC